MCVVASPRTRPLSPRRSRHRRSQTEPPGFVERCEVVSRPTRAEPTNLSPLRRARRRRASATTDSYHRTIEGGAELAPSASFGNHGHWLDDQLVERSLVHARVRLVLAQLPGDRARPANLPGPVGQFRGLNPNEREGRGDRRRGPSWGGCDRRDQTGGRPADGTVERCAEHHVS